MESTREKYANRTSKPGLNHSQINHLLFNLHELKEILYFSACRPEVFQPWVQQHIEEGEQEVLREYSQQFLNKFLPGFTLDEASLVDKQQAIYEDRKVFAQLRAELVRFLNEPNALEECTPQFKNEIKTLCLTLEQFFAERDDYVRSAELAMSPEYLFGLWQYQVEIVKLQTNIHDVIDNYMQQHRHAIKPVLPDLLSAIRHKFIAISENQRQVEESVTEKRKAHEFEASIMVLLLEDRVDKLSHFFKKNADMAVFLNANISHLRPIEKKFQHYLARHSDLLPKPISTHENTAMQENKARAAKAYQHHLQQEVIERDQKWCANHASAGKYYSDNKLTEALTLYLKGAKEFQPDHLYSAGEMILKGVGCKAYAFAACDFFRAAAILSHDEGQRQAAKEKLKEAYRRTMLEPGMTWDIEASSTHQDINATCAVLHGIDKRIKATSHGDLAKKYCNAADAYMAQYQIELVYKQANQDLPSLSLKEVCRYYLAAFEFVDRLYTNAKTVHENFLIYAKRHAVDLDQIDEVDLEGLDDEVKAICYRYKEVQKNVKLAKDEYDNLINKIARKLAPLYCFIKADHGQDKALIDELCHKMEINLATLHTTMVVGPVRRGL